MDGPGESGDASSTQPDRTAGRQRKRSRSAGPGDVDHVDAGTEELVEAAQALASVEHSAISDPAAAAAGPGTTVAAAVQYQGSSDTDRPKKKARRPQWVRRVIVRHLRQLSPRTDKENQAICAHFGRKLEKQIDNEHFDMLMQRVLGGEHSQVCSPPTSDELGAEDGAAIYMARLLSACSGTLLSAEQYKKCVVKQGAKWVVVQREFTELGVTPWTWALPFKASAASDTSITIADVKAALKVDAQVGASSAVAEQPAAQSAGIMPPAESHAATMAAWQQLMATHALNASTAASAANNAAIVANNAAAHAMAVAAAATHQGATLGANLNQPAAGTAAATTSEANHTGPAVVMAAAAVAPATAAGAESLQQQQCCRPCRNAVGV